MQLLFINMKIKMDLWNIYSLIYWQYVGLLFILVIIHIEKTMAFLYICFERCLTILRVYLLAFLNIQVSLNEFFKYFYI